MNLNWRSLLQRPALALGAFLYTWSALVSAGNKNAPGSLSNAPLGTQGGVASNVLILIDSSNSMDWDLKGNKNYVNEEDKRITIAKKAATELVRELPEGSLNVGLAKFYNGLSSYYSGAEILFNLDKLYSIGAINTKQTIMNKIASIEVNGGTPLAEAASAAGRYFTYGLADGTKLDPHPKGLYYSREVETIFKNTPKFTDGVEKPSEVIEHYCQQNFLVLMTDGEPSGDGNVSSYLQNYYNSGGRDKYLDDVTKALRNMDLRPDLDNKNTKESAQNFVSTYIVGFADGALKDNELMKSAAAQGGGEYLFTENGEELKKALTSVLGDAASAGGTPTAAAFSSTSLQENTKVFQARFSAEHWSGELEARSINQSGQINNESTVWKASEMMRKQDARKVFTFDGEKGIVFNSDLLNENSNEPLSAHKRDLQVNITGTGARALDRLDYLLGASANEGEGDNQFRRRISVDNDNLHSKLGDIVHSAPVYLGAPKKRYREEEESYQTFINENKGRQALVFVGANDGMLHAFNADTGEEVFAYIPKLLLSEENSKGLHYLTGQSYSHRYYVDLTVSTRDVKIDGKWRTLLAGGFGAGGKGYFFLDVTNVNNVLNETIVFGEYGPDKFKENDSNDPEFDPDDPGENGENDKDMGYSFSLPKIAQFANGKWGVAFGNGYNSESGKAVLYIYWLDDKEVTRYEAGNNSANSQYKNGLSTPALVDLDLDGKVDRAYAGDVQGNMWGFEFSTSNNEKSLDASSYKLFSTDNGHAITQSPRVATNIAVPRGEGPNLMVLFGSGQYLTAADLQEGTASAYYGVWDNGKGRNLSSGNLHDRELTTTPAKKGSLDTSGGQTVRITNDADINWKEKYGWYMELNEGKNEGVNFYAGERVIVESHLKNTVLFFNTAIPIVSSCSSGGTGWVMSVDFATGKAPNFPVFDANNDGAINDGDKGYVGEKFEDFNSAENPDEKNSSNPGILDGGSFIDPGDDGSLNPPNGNPSEITEKLIAIINGNEGDFNIGPGNNQGRLSWEELGR